MTVFPVLRVRIPGLPAQQGSKRHVGNGVMVEDNPRLMPWRTHAIACIEQAIADQDVPKFSGPCLMEVAFFYPRPLAHFGRRVGATYLKPSAPEFKASAPDLDKLLRAVSDALTQAGAWRDDAVLAHVEAVKRYTFDGDGPSTLINLTDL